MHEKAKLRETHVSRAAGEDAKRSAGLDVPALEEKIAGRLGEEEHATREDGSPSELQSDNCAPSGVGGLRFHRVVDDGGKEKTDRDSPLVETDDGTTVLLGRTLGLVHRNQAGDDSDTESSDYTSGDKDTEGGVELHADTDAEDCTGGHDTVLASKEVTDWISEESSEEGT
jgi:hypothetical protein